MTVKNEEILNCNGTEEQISKECATPNSTVLQNKLGTCPNGCPFSCFLLPCEVCVYSSIAFPPLWPICCPVIAVMICASMICPV